MKFAALFADVWRALVRQPATDVVPPAPTHLRGVLRWNPQNCTGCQLCLKDCPANALELITLDKANKRFVMRYHADRCVFCAQCVQNCRFKCLEMSSDQWVLAATSKEPFTIEYGTDDDLATWLARATPKPAAE